jgi:hypothetical protein
MRIAAAVLLSALGGYCAFTQNSDLALMGGISSPKTSEVVFGSNAAVAGSQTSAVQINYARQFLSTKAGDLYVEFPILWGTNAATGLATTCPSSEGTSSSLLLAYAIGSRFTAGCRSTARSGLASPRLALATYPLTMKRWCRAGQRAAQSTWAGGWISA